MGGMKANKNVFVGLSGGVDSAVSAALLKRAGYDVAGVFIKVWTPEWLGEEAERKEVCTWRQDRRDAMRVAAHLDIPFLTLNLENEYKREVVDYMVAEYKAGRVPNPDVMCNKTIKFGAFLDFAKKHGAGFIATGHYARKSKLTTYNLQLTTLLKGVDENKDQTYFLWTLTQDRLAHTLFPIGKYRKEEVRTMARKFGLPNAEKKDSQGLCFVGKIDMKEFLKHFVEERPGDVLNEKGGKIGTHNGATFFTLGQRHGFEITQKGTSDAPHYVVSKDTAKNTIIVSHKKERQAFARKEADLENVNWIGEEPEKNREYHARLWYRGPLVPCRVETTEEAAARVVFRAPQHPTPGQSLVLYDGPRCLGGGVIHPGTINFAPLHLATGRGRQG